MGSKKLSKVELGVLISAILGVWNMILPNLEVIFGMEAKGLAVMTLIMTAVGFIYKQFYPEDIFVTTKRRLVKYKTKIARRFNKKNKN